MNFSTAFESPVPVPQLLSEAIASWKKTESLVGAAGEENCDQNFLWQVNLSRRIDRMVTDLGNFRQAAESSDCSFDESLAPLRKYQKTVVISAVACAPLFMVSRKKPGMQDDFPESLSDKIKESLGGIISDLEFDLKNVSQLSGDIGFFAKASNFVYRVFSVPTDREIKATSLKNDIEIFRLALEHFNKVSSYVPSERQKRMKSPSFRLSDLT